jgi:hypothetical protein
MRTKIVNVLRSRADDLPNGLEDFINALTTAREQIPPEFRAAASIDFDSYSDSSPEIEINYERPFSPEDAAEEARQAENLRLNNEAFARAMYERLRERFGK